MKLQVRFQGFYCAMAVFTYLKEFAVHSLVAQSWSTSIYWRFPDIPSVGYVVGLDKCALLCTLGASCKMFIYSSDTRKCRLRNTDALIDFDNWIVDFNTVMYASRVERSDYGCPPDNNYFRTLTLEDSWPLTYRVFVAKQDFVTAIQECINFSGRILQMKTRARFNFFKSLTHNCSGYDVPFWTALTNKLDDDHTDLNQWRDAYKSPVPITFWADNEPNPSHSNSYHCAQFSVYSENLWRSVSCDTPSAYICQLF